jgi:hypothetical protein
VILLVLAYQNFGVVQGFVARAVLFWLMQLGVQNALLQHQQQLLPS